jgi:multidrug efflux pump subunit AcrA (membrane-fusion protein)
MALTTISTESPPTAGQPWTEVEAFAARVHATLDTDRVAAEIANEGRRLLGCDRLSVLDCRHGRCRMLAISGSDTFDPRSQVVGLIQRLATAVAVVGEPVGYGPAAEPLPPQIETPLEQLRDETHARGVTVLPLAPPPHQPEDSAAPPAGAVQAVLVLEWFEAGELLLAPAVVSAVARHASLALAHAQTHQRIPWLRAWQAVERSAARSGARSWPRLAWVAAAIVLLVALFALVPAPLNVTALGELQPSVRREVFARADGIVDEVLVDSGDTVRAGQVLATLRSAELDFELSRLEGEMRTAQSRLAALRSARLADLPGTSEALERFNQLAAEEERIKSDLAGYEHQLALLRSRQADLQMVSPLDGVVLTWDPRALLTARPVERGQALLRVAQLDGPWELELGLQSRRSGHVFAAQAGAQEPLAVTFVVATNPEQSHPATLVRVAQATTTDEQSSATVLATAAIDPAATQQLRADVAEPLRPGATVRAKIYCGTRSLGYVWLHELYQTLRWWLWL